MPSTRRVKVLAALVALVLCCIVYYSNDADTISSAEFYSRTEAAMEREAQSPNFHSSNLGEHGTVDHDAHEPPAGGKINEPPPIPPVKGQEHEAVLVAPDDKSVKPEKDARGAAGRKKYKGGEHWDVASGKQAPVGEKQNEEEKETHLGVKDEKETKETDEEHKLEVELNSILKKGPIIIFSKSYCPYSKKAKDILLDKYTIVPTPYVVELDEHPLGPGLQAALEKSTGRRTVPNVLINGKSVGGGDDVQKLDLDGELISKVKGMGGKRIMEAKLRGGT
ncbi:MAG: hypothetical protein L6R35_000427 [Caloplaca aegaea]|nr:MAG: hypothetical protein L6R35_000427 [Caloplaca aegaea]